MIINRKSASGQQPTLNAPTISANANVVSISNPATNGNFVTGYGIYKNGTFFADISGTSVTITEDGENNITAKAKGTNFQDSVASNSVLVAKRTITVTCVDCTENAGNPTFIYNNGGTATLYFTPNTGLNIQDESVVISGATVISVSLANNSVTIGNVTGNVTMTVTAMMVSGGLYDKNDNLLATYADSGLIADVDYTSSTCKTKPGSGYCTMQRYPTCKKIILPDTILGIGDYAFISCYGLRSITISDSVISIGTYAFYGCTGLTSVTIGNSVVSIGAYTFYGCTGLTSVAISDSVTSIGNDAFEGCTGLTSVTIGNSVVSIGAYTFYGCTGLTSVAIPDSVESIGSSAFYECKGLTSVTIGNSVVSIGAYTFYGCTGLTSVTIPNTVNFIGYSAFYGCKGLTSVTFNGTPTTIVSYTFAADTSLTDIYVPWSEGAVAGAPWGATNAIIHYNYTP